MRHPQLQDGGVGKRLPDVLVGNPGGDHPQRTVPPLDPVAGKRFRELRKRRIRSSTRTWRALAFWGSMTHLDVSRTKPGGNATPATSPSRTVPLAWEMRVVVRRKTGVSNSSDSAKAILVNSFASSESEGSSMGILAATA